MLGLAMHELPGLEENNAIILAGPGRILSRISSVVSIGHSHVFYVVFSLFKLLFGKSLKFRIPEKKLDSLSNN